jgi:hypothetical protein
MTPEENASVVPERSGNGLPAWDPVPAAQAPDGVEPLVGWRYWRVDGGALGSLTRSLWWPSMRAFEAQCRLIDRHGAVPSPDCHCGIYAANDLDTLKCLARPHLRLPLALGKVALWGRVIPAERGCRAQFAYPKRLWLVWESLEPLKAPGTLRVELADAYGVSVEFCDAEWALQQDGPEPTDDPRMPAPVPGPGWDVGRAIRRLTARIRGLAGGDGA